MRGLLQAALIGDGATLSIRACTVTQAIYLPREDRCNLVYELLIREGPTGAAERSVVAARLFSSQTACRAYLRDRLAPLARLAAGRQETAPFATPVAMLDTLNMAVSIFPLDGDLPTLLLATDSRQMSEVFQRALPTPRNGSPIEGCRVEVAQYRRHGRCVLRYHVARSPAGPDG